MKPLVRLLPCLLSIFLPLASGKTPANTYLACSPCQGLLYGDQVTIGVLVVPDGTGPAPTGPATITWDTSTAQVSLDSAGHGTLIFPSSSLPPLSAGTHIFSSAYSDAYYQAGLPAAVSVEVSKAETILIMGFLATYVNQPTTLRAVIKLSNYSTVPVTGTVNFTSNGNPIGGCTGVPVSGGEATCHPTFSQPGSITIGFAYSGDSNVNPSSNSGSLTIFKRAADAYVAATPTAPAYGDPTSIGVLVTGASGAPTPSGTVTVSWGGSPVTAPLDSGGHASLPLPSLGAGNYTIAATYNGDSNYQTASAASLQLVVAKAGTTVTIGAGAVQVDQPVTLKASVSLANWASLAVTGTVDFTKNGSPVAGCTGVALVAGAAVCTMIFPQASSFTIGATYSGDANANPSSGSTQLTVGKMAATAYVAASPASPTYGDAITIGLLVSGATGAPTPTGTASIIWGGATLSATLDSTGRGSVIVPSAFLPLPAAGSYTITGSYNGDSNYQAAPAAPFQLVLSKAGTTVTISSSALQINQPVTLRATVSLANWANMPISGTVDFSMGGSPLGGCTGLALQNGGAVCTATFPQLGGLTVSARYSGDANTNPSTGSIPLSVCKVAASAYLAAVPVAPIFGAQVTITALVLGANGVAAPTGNVTFRDGSAPLATLALNASGQAVLVAPSSSVPSLPAGAHTITATYNGDANYVPSALVSLTLPVGKAATVLSLSPEPGGPFVATVAVRAPGSGTPTGSVQFSRNGAPLATIPLAPPGPSATVATSSQGGNIAAAYSGDSNFTGSTAAPVAVAAPLAAVFITSDHNPSTPGQPVTFYVYLTPEISTATPTGSVSLSVDGASLGTAWVNAAQATFTTNLAAGTHAISASYAGDAVYPSASAAYSQIVSKTAASLMLSADSQGAVFGQPVTLSARLSAPAGSAQPGGEIAFYDGSNNLGTVTVSGGTASFALANLSVGQHLVTASWAGDSNWSPATSQAVLLSITKAQTTTNLIATPTSLNVTVAAMAPAVGTPTGSIRLTDANTHSVLATATLNNGGATNTVPSGAAAVVAEYSGDNNFLGSASSSLPELTATNAASYATDRFAPDEIVTLFGNNLASATATSGAQPQTMLGGSSVQVTDANGKNHAAPMLFVSPSQASLVLPQDTPPGPGTVSVTNPSGVTVGSIAVANVAPGLFTVNGTGQGAPAGQTVRVHSDGSVDSPQELAAFDAAQSLWTPVSIDLSASGDTVYLVLYGTGFRHFSSIPICSIADQSIPASFAGAQGSFAGLDQVNIPLPPTLEGIGTTTLTLSVDGVVSNPVTLAFQ